MYIISAITRVEVLALATSEWGKKLSGVEWSGNNSISPAMHYSQLQIYSAQTFLSF